MEVEGKGGRHYNVCRLEQNKSRDENEGLRRTPEAFRTHNKNEQTLKMSFICRRLQQVILERKYFSKSLSQLVAPKCK